MRKKKPSLPRFGKLLPKYRFIHVQPRCPTTINKHCRYCLKCDILIAHQDELERMLVLAFQKHNLEMIGNEYLVLGTLEPSSWRKREKEPIDYSNVQEHVHDFKEHLSVKYTPAHWGPAKE